MNKPVKIILLVSVALLLIVGIYPLSNWIKDYSKVKRIHYLIAEYMKKERVPAEKEELLRQFRNIGDEATEYMLKDLKRAADNLDKGSSTVWGSAIILADLKEMKAIPYYVKLLNSNYPGLHLIAATSLCRLGDKRGLEGLFTVIKKSKNFGERKAALYQLGKYGNLDSIARLELLSEKESDKRIPTLIERTISEIKERSEVIFDVDSPPYNL